MRRILCKLMKNKEKQAVKVGSHHPATSKGSRPCHPWTESSKWRPLKVRVWGCNEEDLVIDTYLLHLFIVLGLEGIKLDIS
jgi:hypothetical protein